MLNHKDLGISDKVYKEALKTVRGGNTRGRPSPEEQDAALALAMRLQKQLNRKSKERKRKFALMDKREAMKQIANSKYFQEYIEQTGIRAKDIIKQMLLFCAAYYEFGVLSKAEVFTGISNKDRIMWQKECEAFAEGLNNAKEDFLDNLEAIGIKRAMEKSDSLLKFFLQAYRSEKFRPSMDMSLTGDGAMVRLEFSKDMLSPEEVRMLENEKKEMVN